MFIDIVFFILIVLAVIKGYSKGFIVALFSVLGFVVGLAAALKLSSFVALQLADTLQNLGKWLPVISFLVVFITVVILVRMGAKLIQSSMEMVLLGWLNRLAGVLLYALLYGIIFSVFLFYSVQLNLLSQSTIESSNIYPYLQPLAPKIIDGLGEFIPWFKDMFAQLQAFFESIAT
ncbi:MAG TPA: CvpA family protein [Ferruginibacter sp.]|nr:CvpA family protein [Ferruginibacter sp.]HRE62633.1 CvpA family protein [Ferruginibacter sp.]